MEKIASNVDEVLRSVPLGKEARTKQLGAVHGNPALGGYDCVIVSLLDEYHTWARYHNISLANNIHSGHMMLSTLFRKQVSQILEAEQSVSFHGSSNY